MSQDRVCLVIIFNHRFDKNLPILRRIYGEKFSHIRFLMPFYDGADSDVIPVYESSYQFQGYFIQAYEKLNNIQCSHYLFIGDDLIIHPQFDEYNFTTVMQMQGGEADDKHFLSCEFVPLNRPDGFRWHWTAGSSEPFFDKATSYKDSIYTYEEALSKFNKFFGAPYKEFYDEDFFGNIALPFNTVLGAWNNIDEFGMVLNRFIAINRNSLKIPYPMASGYSDIFCIEKSRLFEFARLCGIFSAMNMFVEIAIPTAAVLTFERNDVEFFPKGSAMLFWDNDRIAFEEKYNRDFKLFYDNWEEAPLFVHPIKLSQWKV